MADYIVSPEGSMFRQTARLNSFARIVVIGTAGFTLAACGSAAAKIPAPTTKASVSSSASATANPADIQALLAVADQAIPFYPTLNGCPGCPKYNVYADCALYSGGWGYSRCPITPRLLAYFQQQRPYGLCRSCTQGSPTRTMTAELTPTGGVVHVVLYDGLLKLDLIMVKLNGQYLIDDSTCTGGGPQTSIYNPAPDTGPPNAWTCGFTG
jgi:hypothetical protein